MDAYQEVKGDLVDKLVCIVKFIKNFITIHYFLDANHRVFVLGALNFLLLRFGFNKICLLKNSRVFFTSSIDDICDIIIQNLHELTPDMVALSEVVIPLLDSELVEIPGGLIIAGISVSEMRKKLSEEEVQFLYSVRGKFSVEDKENFIHIMDFETERRAHIFSNWDYLLSLIMLTEKTFIDFLYLYENKFRFLIKSMFYRGSLGKLLDFFPQETVFELSDSEFENLVTKSSNFCECLKAEVSLDTVLKMNRCLNLSRISSVLRVAKHFELDIEDFCKTLCFGEVKIDSLFGQMTEEQYSHIGGERDILAAVVYKKVQTVGRMADGTPECKISD